MQAARELVGDLAEQVSIPAVYRDIRQLILDPRATIDDSVAVIAADSMLALRVRRMAASGYFGLPRECPGLRQACEIIGLMQLHDLVLALLCMRTFSGVPGELFDDREFWRHGVRRGIAARGIGYCLDGHENNIYFALGLFAEIGHAAMYLKYPEAASRALDLSLESGRRIDEVERELFGFDYAELGAELARLWRLPPAWEQAAAFHLEPDRADPPWLEAVTIAHLARRYCDDAQALRPLDSGPELGPAARAAVERLPGDIAGTLDALLARWSEPVLAMLWPHAEAELTIVGGHG